MFSRRPDYLLKVRGMSMRDAGIMDGDLLAVQKAREAQERPDRRRPPRRRGHRQALQAHPQHASSCCPRTPTSSPSSSAPATRFEIEGLAVGLIRNNMLM